MLLGNRFLAKLHRKVGAVELQDTKFLTCLFLKGTGERENANLAKHTFFIFWSFDDR